MQISKLRKEINDELTTVESQLGDMDIKELSLVDRSDRLDISYKTASPVDQRKAALESIKDKIRDSVRYFNEYFEDLTDAEKASIKMLECLKLDSLSDTAINKDTRRKDFADLKQSIRSMVAKYVSKNGQMSEAECASLSGMSCLNYDHDRYRR